MTRAALVVSLVLVGCGSDPASGPASATTSGGGGAASSAGPGGAGAAGSASSSSTGGGAATCVPQGGLGDGDVHAPPATGPFAYNGFALPPTPGASYAEPVFGTTVRRVSTDHVADDIYARNMWWSADETRYLHRTTGGGQFADYWEVIDVATGAVMQQAIPIGGLAADGGFDPADPNVVFSFQGSDLHATTLNSDGTWTDAVYFTAPAPLRTLGGTLNWLDASGRWMLVRYGSEPSVHLYDRRDLAAGPYANPIDASTSVDGGSYLGLTPDGRYVVGYDDGIPGKGMGSGVSFAIDHANRSIATAPKVFWDLCGDHGAFLSASDGRDYMVVYNCNENPELWRVDVTNDVTGLSEAEEKALPGNLRLVTWPTWDDAGHVTTVARGPCRDWAFVSSEDGTDTFDSGADDGTGSIAPWHAYRQEILGFDVTTGEVRRLAHHQSRSPAADYYNSNRVSASWAGKWVGFASNFDQPGQVDIYAIPF